MGLRFRFNATLILVFLLGLGGAAYVFYDLLQRNARDEVVRTAGLMMEAAIAIRGYTVDQVKPHLELQLTRAFLPQSVPAYAATEILNDLQAAHSEYSYKEATLNPTNPRNRATDWETDLVNEFRRDGELKEMVGTRNTPTGPSLYIARPIKIAKEACLVCHTTPAKAPETMVKVYGNANGFGWNLDETIGAQVVSVPMSVPIENARRAFVTFLGALCAVFLVVFIVLNILLNRLIIGPITRVSRAAERVSTGDFDIPEFDDAGKDEISGLARAFNRMRRSLEQAMKMISDR